MIVGVPKEVLPGDRRVGLSPVGEAELAEQWTRVVVESGAGRGALFSDTDCEVADALLHGKASTSKGNYQPVLQRFRCAEGHEWDVPFGQEMAEPSRICPHCGSSDLLTLPLKGSGEWLEMRPLGAHGNNP